MVGPQVSRWSRVGRGALLAAFSVFVAAMSHLIAGGHSPALLATGLAFTFAVLASTFALGKHVTLARLIVAVGLSQVLFHLLFSVDAAGNALVSGGGHHGGELTVTTGAIPPHNSEGLAMWIAHGVAAVVTVVAVRLMQRSLRRAGFAPRLRFVDRALQVLVPVIVRRSTPVGFVEPTRLSLEHRVLAVPDRGPPVAFA